MTIRCTGSGDSEEGTVGKIRSSVDSSTIFFNLSFSVGCYLGYSACEGVDNGEEGGTGVSQGLNRVRSSVALIWSEDLTLFNPVTGSGLSTITYFKTFPVLFLMKCRSRKVREAVTRLPGILKYPGNLNFPGNFPTRESRISTLLDIIIYSS